LYKTKEQVIKILGDPVNLSRDYGIPKESGENSDLIYRHYSSYSRYDYIFNV